MRDGIQLHFKDHLPNPGIAEIFPVTRCEIRLPSPGAIKVPALERAI
jgi:hypothetical protein